MTKVKNIRNAKDNTRNFDIEKLLSRNSDCLFGYIGSYKNDNGQGVLVSSSEADYNVYCNMETSEIVKVPTLYKNLFEKQNFILNLLNRRVNNIQKDDMEEEAGRLRALKYVSQR